MSSGLEMNRSYVGSLRSMEDEVKDLDPARKDCTI